MGENTGSHPYEKGGSMRRVSFTVWGTAGD